MTELKWEDTQVAVTKTRLTKPRTVALCGFAPSSRDLAPYNKKTVEIWGCNEAYAADFMKTSDGEFRADRWFQIHLEEDWSRKNNPNDKRHPEWLAQEHNFPIYMQEKFDGVPNAVKYPIDEISQEYFKNLYTIKDDGEWVPWLDAFKNGYFTSSFAYMMALAVHEGFERIEIWGFNMGAQSEYLYQKGSAEFWIEAALGRGIEVGIAGKSPILRGELYGYEFSQIIQAGALQERIAELERSIVPYKEDAVATHGRRYETVQIRKHLETMESAVEAVAWINQHHETLLEKEVEATGLVNFYLGALWTCNLILRHIEGRHDKSEGDWGIEDGWVGRLSLEVQMAQIRQTLKQTESRNAQISGARMELLKTMQDAEISSWDIDRLDLRLKQLRQAEIETTNQINYQLGILNQIQMFLLDIDQRTPNQVQEYDMGYRVSLDLTGKDIDVLAEGSDGEETKTTE